MDNPATMNLHNLREHISNLEFRRDKLGCEKDVIDRLNAARTELSSRMKRRKTKKILPGEILCDEAYYARVKEIQKSIKNGTHPEVRLNKGGTLL